MELAIYGFALILILSFATRCLIDKGVNIVETPESFKQELLKASAPLFEAWKKSAAKMGVDAQAPIDFYKAQTAAAGS